MFTKMAATMKKTAAEDVNITFEDQQKIKKFAQNTSRITELKEEIEVKKKQLQNLEDVCEDIMLADDNCLMTPYHIGDVFINHSQEETQEMLEEAKKNLQEETDALESRMESIQWVLADLKVQFSCSVMSDSFCNPMNHSRPGLPVHHQLPESIQTHVH
ncbi:prefoldin subunit 4-like [Bos javanicus]|uniref:prefoldin subunit 4-like n=1 Tax=Bos javanicus TaxID=9906 RepID=UPI002AA8AE64|nr:prefoldin subunit 4-like [Bos javanicus]